MPRFIECHKISSKNLQADQPTTMYFCKKQGNQQNHYSCPVFSHQSKWISPLTAKDRPKIFNRRGFKDKLINRGFYTQIAG
jgi:predicted nucleotide-binding protein (sugar kinase/HSP70/actin superfamily)